MFSDTIDSETFVQKVHFFHFVCSEIRYCLNRLSECILFAYRFGHLSFEMHRACRLIADTGIHYYGYVVYFPLVWYQLCTNSVYLIKCMNGSLFQFRWTHDEAFQLFLENTALSEFFITNEVRRYITWPGQVCVFLSFSVTN